MLGRSTLWVALALAALTACAGPGSGSGGGVQRVASIPVGNNAGIPAFGFGSLWAPNSSDGTVSRVDLGSNRVTATIRVGDYATFHAAGCDRYGSVHSYMVTNWTIRQCDQPTGIAAGSDVVWVTRDQDRSLVSIDPRTNQVGPEIPLPIQPFQLAAHGTELWVTSLADSAVAIVDEPSRRVVDVLRGFPAATTGITFYDGAAWIVSSYEPALTKVDPLSHRVLAKVVVPCATVCYSELRPLAITAAFGHLWLRNEGNGTLARVDPGTLAVSTFVVDSFWGRDGLDSIGAFDGSLWIGGLRLQQVSPDGRVVRRYPWTSTVVSSGQGSLWFTDGVGRLVRVR